ncbi:MAG: RsmB/NOP family class I SAM-dependent RNA methyltransferase [Eggerthellaceae bacterium]|nr:RsmB/NOP family class I SAM-dependent RNA methyltransferase [Eggerthellaceae bacterium]
MSEHDSTIAFPEFFEPLLAESYNAKDIERILQGSNSGRAVSLRANTLKSSSAEITRCLDEANITYSPVTWYDDAFVIHNATVRDIWPLDAYEQGKLYLQSLSSMLPPLVLGAKPGIDILDMCAAPGGKTSQLAALGGPGTHITACEMSVPRAEKLEHNLRKLGAGNVLVMRQDARRLDDFFRFDRILVDAPCSGSGTLRAGDPKVFKRFTPALVQKCQHQQAALLDKALSLLKPGGTLVYSTCSVLPCENEQQVESALKRARKRGTYEVVPIVLPGADDLPLLPNALPGTLTICPTNRYEGFFVAKIIKKR